MSEFDITVDHDRLRRLQDGAVVATGFPAIFQVTGPGALQCLQGLLTSDLVRPGEHSLVYGALLTPKGMVVVDYWVLRQAQELMLIAPIRGRDPSLELFAHRLPPRLAKVTDLTGQYGVAWLLGSQAITVLDRAMLGGLPDGFGRTSTGGSAAGALILARAPEAAPFAALVVGLADAVAAAVASLVGAGATLGNDIDVEVARILAGWPGLGAEIDEKTLPQEIRYDEIGGVSYTKGCYTGQETVARLHFRGHPNRELRGLLWQGATPLDGRVIDYDGREAGTVRSTLTLPDRVVGLAKIRREVPVGLNVLAGGRMAEVVGLPFTTEQLVG